MGNTITIASTILLGFGTIISVPNTYENYDSPDYEIGSSMPKDMSKNISFDTTDSTVFQVSALNYNESIVNELNSFIHSIVDDSKSLDADISKFVSEHFWELV